MIDSDWKPATERGKDVFKVLRDELSLRWVGIVIEHPEKIWKELKLMVYPPWNWQLPQKVGPFGASLAYLWGKLAVRNKSTHCQVVIHVFSTFITQSLQNCEWHEQRPKPWWNLLYIYGFSFKLPSYIGIFFEAMNKMNKDPYEPISILLKNHVIFRFCFRCSHVFFRWNPRVCDAEVCQDLLGSFSATTFSTVSTWYRTTAWGVQWLGGEFLMRHKKSSEKTVRVTDG